MPRPKRTSEKLLRKTVEKSFPPSNEQVNVPHYLSTKYIRTRIINSRWKLVNRVIFVGTPRASNPPLPTMYHPLFTSKNVKKLAVEALGQCLRATNGLLKETKRPQMGWCWRVCLDENFVRCLISLRNYFSFYMRNKFIQIRYFVEFFFFLNNLIFQTFAKTLLLRISTASSWNASSRTKIKSA